MIELVELFNLERTAAGKPEIRIGIGIASGEMVAGYAGTTDRATYTCIGDVVNLASRIEGHTKVAQRAILIDDATRGGLGERIAVEALGPIAFKGKTGSGRNVRGDDRREALTPVGRAPRGAPARDNRAAPVAHGYSSTNRFERSDSVTAIPMRVASVASESVSGGAASSRITSTKACASCRNASANRS